MNFKIVKLFACLAYLLVNTNKIFVYTSSESSNIVVRTPIYNAAINSSEVNRNCPSGILGTLQPTIDSINSISTDFYVTLVWSVGSIDKSCIKQVMIKYTASTLQNVLLETTTFYATGNNIVIRNLGYLILHCFKVTLINEYNEMSKESIEECRRNPAITVKINTGTLPEPGYCQLKCTYDPVYDRIINSISWYYNENRLKTTENTEKSTNVKLQKSGTYKCEINLRNRQSFNSTNVVDIDSLLSDVSWNSDVVKIIKTELTDKNAVKITLDKFASGLNVNKYRIALSSDNFETSIFWPAQLTKTNNGYKDKDILSIITSSFYECFNECIENPDCIAVTTSITDKKIQNCFLKATSTNSVSLPINSENRILQSFSSSTSELILTDLPFNQRYKIKVSVYDSTNKYWSKYSEESEPVDMLIKLTYTFQRIGIKTHEIKWTHDRYTISRFAIVTKESSNETLIDNINNIQTFNIDPNYYEFPFDTTPEHNVLDSNECLQLCLNRPKCVQYLYFKKATTLFGIQIPSNSCYFRESLNIQNGVICDSNIVECRNLKSTLQHSFYKINGETNLAVVGITPYGSRVESNYQLINRVVLDPPSLTSTNYISTNFSVLLSWTFNGIEKKYINQSVIKYRLLQTDPPLVRNFTTNEFKIWIPNLNYTSMKHCFKVYIEDIFGDYSEDSTERCHSNDPFIPKFSVNGTVFIESTTLKLTCYYDSGTYSRIVDNITWHNEEKLIDVTANTQLELEIYDIKESESGNYRCRLNLKNGQFFDSTSINLTILKVEPIISKIETINDNSIRIKINAFDKKLQITRYRVQLIGNDFQMYWPSQLIRQKQDLVEQSFKTLDTKTSFECFEECIKNSDCLAVSMKTALVNKANCFLKSSKTNMSQASSNFENRILTTEFSSANTDIILTNLPYNEKFKVKVSVFESTNKFWSKLSNEMSFSFDIDLNVGYKRIGITRYLVEWNQKGTFKDYIVSRFNVIENENQYLNINQTSTFTPFILEPEYHEIPFDLSVQKPVQNENECYSHCIASSKCVQFIYFDSKTTVYDQSIEKGSCYLRDSLNLSNGIIYDSRTSFVKSIKSSFYKTHLNFSKPTNISIEGITPYGSRFRSNNAQISYEPMIPIISVKSNSSQIFTMINISYNTTFDFNLTRYALSYNRNSSNLHYYFEGSESSENFNDFELEIIDVCYAKCFEDSKCWSFDLEYPLNNNSTCQLNTNKCTKIEHLCIYMQGYTNEIKIDALRLNTNYTFKVIAQDEFGVKSETSKEFNLKYDMIVSLKINGSEFTEGKTTSFECVFTEIDQKYIESILWYKNDSLISGLEGVGYSNNNRTITFTYLNHTIHNGVYNCIVKTNKTKSQYFTSNQILMTILFGPFLQFTRINSSTDELYEGDENVTLTCTISCSAFGYKIPDISIYFKNEKLNNTKVMSNEQELTKTVSFTFDLLSRDNNGTYTCKVDDKEISASLDLIVYYQFIIQVSNSNGTDDTVADFNTSCYDCKIEIPCTVNGYSSQLQVPPKPVWTYENSSRVPEKFINTTNDRTNHTTLLVFKEMKREYSGLYKCLLENNTQGIRDINKIIEFRIIIRSAPSTPILKRSVIYSDKTEIEWQIDDYGDIDKTNLTVEWTTKDKSENKTFVASVDNSTIYSIPIQLPKDCEIRIQASNVLGPSGFSNLINPKCSHVGCHTSVIVGVVCAVVAIALIIGGVVVYRRRIRKRTDEPDEIIIDEIPIAEGTIDYLINKWTKNIPTIESDLKKEYSEIKNPQDLPQKEAKKEINRVKNRFKDISPYDYNRVILSQIGDQLPTDYINASEIRGFDNATKFIAAQGPNEYTVFDFWRMVYEKNVKAIVMLTNFYEGNKKKCEEYWDNSNEFYCDHLSVKMTSFEDNLNYQKRKFLIKSMNASEGNLIVDHYHYTNWPDYGVPEETQTILSLIDRVNKEHGRNDWPIVVHCSAGVGRTGTYIALDILLESIRTNSKLDINQCVRDLRRQRVFLVQTADQYSFVHLALIEYQTFGNTTMDRQTCTSEFQGLVKPTKSKKMNQNKLNGLFKKICEIPDAHRTTESFNGFMHKFKSTSFIPYDSTCVKLTKIDNDMSSIHVDASLFQTKQFNADFYLVSDPAEPTLLDFFRLILEHRPAFIVSFSTPLYLPKLKEKYTSNNNQYSFQVENKTAITRNTVTYNNLEFVNLVTNERHSLYYIDHTSNWPQNSKFPTNTASFVKLVNFLITCGDNKENRQLIFVQSADAGDRCAIFIASLLLVNRIRIHQMFDVVQVVRMLRKSRKNLISDVETFKYLYTIACGDIGSILQQPVITDPLYENA